MNAGISMNENGRGGADAAGVVGSAGLSAGGLLQQARQAAGMHIAALAAALKVPVNKIEALEADDHAVLPDIVFVRALAASVCRTLRTDPDPVLALLPPIQGPRLSVSGPGIGAPLKGGGVDRSAAFSGSRSFGLLVLALLVGAGLLFFLPRQQGGSALAPLSAPATASSQAVDAPAPAEQALDKDLAASAAGAASSAAATPASADAAATSSLLVLRARGETWVQVRDASGVFALQRVLAPGESVSFAASTPLPLAVVIGRANMTEALVRDKSMNLAPVSRDNVARFEVK